MIWAVLLLIPAALAVSLPTAALTVRLGRRLRALDAPGVPGQVKAAARDVPNIGGVAIFAGLVLPLAVLLAAVAFLPDALGALAPAVKAHLPGVRAQTATAVTFVACLAAMHALGLIDDRRAMGPFVKLGIMALAAAALVWRTDTRLLTLLDAHVGGAWLSIALTVLWFVVVTNAMNFMDNMDGLSAGVGIVAAGCFLAAAVLHGQWFVGGTLALLIGALLGFLAFNFPRARLFMGDGGSLVLGFALAFLTTRTTYYPGDAPGGANPWYAVLMPLMVLAVPLYDFASVVTIRLSQGRSPFVGDLRHLSHRLARRGLSRRAAVMVIWGLTAITGLTAIPLGFLAPWQAAVAGAQVFLILGVIAAFEWASDRRAA